MDAEMASQPAVDAEVQPAPDEKMIAYPYPENQILVYKYDFAGELPELPSELPVYQFKNTTTALPWKSGIFDVDSINL
ncbi:MAG: hypothetical protein H6765_08830 [Candidatus Peribacteria bacterium]|nr:MAG: hypothetical protein H6765_08830 [Candidatus Peribacteria bacterium]